MHWTASLVHSSRCLDNQCTMLTCRVMKDLIHHQKLCDRRTDPEKCDACKQYTIICSYHAMDCKSFKCPVPFCGTIKDWIECGSFPDDMRYAWNKDVLDSFLGLRSYEAGSDGSDLPSQGPLSFVGWVWYLYHYSLCGDDGCSTLVCGKMNDVLDHYSSCEVRRGEKTCNVCEELTSLCGIHAERCMEDECYMPLCETIRFGEDDDFEDDLVTVVSTFQPSDDHVNNLGRSEMVSDGSHDARHARNVRFISDAWHALDARNIRYYSDVRDTRVIRDVRDTHGTRVEPKMNTLRWSWHLVHARECHVGKCPASQCRRLKKVMSHYAGCLRRRVPVPKRCHVCTQFLTLCCLHAKVCAEEQCSLPFCSTAKMRMQKVKGHGQQQQQQQKMTQMKRNV